MAQNYNSFLNGVAIVPKGTSENSIKGDIEVLTTDNRISFHNGTSSSGLVSIAHAAQGADRLQLKDLDASNVKIVDATDITKTLAFTVAGATTGFRLTLAGIQTANRTITFPDATDTVVTLATSQTLTNKILSGNTATNLVSGSGTLTLNTSGTVTVPNGTDTLVNLTGTQTISGKTLTSPVINSQAADTIIGISGGPLTVSASLNQNLALLASGTGKITLNGFFSVDSSSISGSTGASTTLQSGSGENLRLNAQGSAVVSLLSNSVAVAEVGTAALRVLDQGTLQLREATGNGTNYIGLRAPASVATDYTVTLPASAPTAGTALAYNGTDYVWASAGGWTMSTSLSLTAGGTVSISLTTGQQAIEVQSNSGVVTLSTTPFGTSAPSNGVVIRLIGRSNTNGVTLVNSDIAFGAILNGNITLYLGDSIDFMYLSSLNRFVETSRNN